MALGVFRMNPRKNKTWLYRGSRSDGEGGNRHTWILSESGNPPASGPEYIATPSGPVAAVITFHETPNYAQVIRGWIQTQDRTVTGQDRHIVGSDITASSLDEMKDTVARAVEELIKGS